MALDDVELLNRYRLEGSESAFVELIRRHLNLVYSAALRQVAGDTHAAEDVTQAVFIDLARRSERLAAHTSLIGWLYTSTRFLAANQRRADQRRRQREEIVAQMNQTLGPSEPAPNWDQLRPVLDDAMHDLSEADRDAVLWRHFEQRPYAELGARLGVSENAARMRVDRALDQLRKALSQRGVTSTAAALGVALAEQAVLAAPDGLSGRLAESMAASMRGKSRTVAKAGLLAGLLGGVAKWALVGLVAVGLVTGLVLLRSQSDPTSSPTIRRMPGREGEIASRGEPKQPTAVDPTAGVEPTSTSANGSRKAADPGDPSELVLTVLAAASGKPIAGADLYLPRAPRGYRGPKKPLTDASGVVVLAYPPDTTELRVVASAEGYAATLLHWAPGRGIRIPPAYTVRLAPAVLIGGLVVNAEGTPIEESTVNFSHTEDLRDDETVESHDFVWLTTQTDRTGRWHLHRIAVDMLSRIRGRASHPNYVISPTINLSVDPSPLQALRDQTYVFRLGTGVEIHGQVVNPEGEPVDRAKVRVGGLGGNTSREGETDAAGWFHLKGCAPGVQPVTGEADGYAAATLEVEVKANLAPLRLTLAPARLVRVRALGPDGTPIAKAWVNYDTQRGGGSAGNAIAARPVQAEFSATTDADGWITWKDAPAGSLSFDIAASGFLRRDGVIVGPEDQEVIANLDRALTVYGNVRDAKSGEPVTQFRMTAGWPQKMRYGTNTAPRWCTGDICSVVFREGHYRHSFEYALLGREPNPGYYLRFSAEGYAPFVSRLLKPEEGEVQLDIQLHADPGVTITVLTPSGQPAGGAQLAILDAGNQVIIEPTGFDQNTAVTGTQQQSIGADGRLSLTSIKYMVRIVFFHDQGFLQLLPVDLSPNAVITLLPWGRIEGTILVAGQPADGQELLLETPDDLRNEVGLDAAYYYVKSDAHGQFHLPKVPPGPLKLTRLTRRESPDGWTGWTHVKSTDVEVRPGGVTKVVLEY